MTVWNFLNAAFSACLVCFIIASGLATAELGPDLQHLLSKEAQIYYPGSVGYKNATTRWASAVRPGLDVVVKVASEADVQQTVR